MRLVPIRKLHKPIIKIILIIAINITTPIISIIGIVISMIGIIVPGMVATIMILILTPGIALIMAVDTTRGEIPGPILTIVLAGLVLSATIGEAPGTTDG